MTNSHLVLLSFSKGQSLFLRHLEKNNRAPNTIVAYRGDLGQLGEFLTQANKADDLTRVKREDIEAFKKKLEKDKYTPKSISRKLNSVKSFFKFLLQEGVIETDPAQAVAHPQLSDELPQILRPIEYRALRDVCRNDLRTLAIVQLILQIGLRISEVANLRLDDVGENTLRVRAEGSHLERQVPFNQVSKKAVENYLRVRVKTKDDHLFVTKTGRPLVVRNIRTIINRYFRKAGLEGVRVNDLRNTFIVQQLQAGVPLEVVSQIVGHRRISTTEKYLRLVNQQKSARRGFHLVEL